MDNTIYIVEQVLKYYKARVTNESLHEFLLKHPQYPNMVSVVDVLNEWNIKHYALKLSVDEMSEMEIPFIAHVKDNGGQFIFINKIKNGTVYYQLESKKRKQLSLKEFEEKVSGAVIIIDPDNKGYESNYKEKYEKEWLNKALLPLLISCFIFFSIYRTFADLKIIQYGINLALIGINVVGLIASIFLILHEFKIKNTLSDKLCGFSSKTDCDEVLQSKAGLFFAWIKWADVGIIFFTGTLLYLFGLTDIKSLTALSFLSALSLPYSAFSIYYQAIKLKKWCPFCLITQIALIIQFILLIPYLHLSKISFQQILSLFYVLILSTCCWLLYRAYRIMFDKYNNIQHTHLKLKYNPKIFISLLEQNERKEIAILENSLLLGDRNAPVTITAFLSLYCNPCADAFNKLQVLLERCSQVKINVIFSVYADKETEHLVNTIYYYRHTKSQKELIQLLSDWYSSSQSSRKNLYTNITIPDQYKVAKQIGEYNNPLYKNYKIQGTPSILINGYKFPDQYAYSDVEFFIDKIIQLSQENILVES